MGRDVRGGPIRLMNVCVETAKVHHPEHERPGFICGGLRLERGKAGFARGRGLRFYFVLTKLEGRR